MWLKHPCWKWFKAFCQHQADLQMNQLLTSDPTQDAHLMARAQGHFAALSAISGGMLVNGGEHISYEQFLIETLQDQMQDNAEAVGL